MASKPVADHANEFDTRATAPQRPVRVSIGRGIVGVIEALGGYRARGRACSGAATLTTPTPQGHDMHTKTPLPRGANNYLRAPR
ncbi:DUF1067 domain-containing protein [Mycobacterium leprae]|uniref:DUF1067 domain-containing protein n=1 Tax=Mycobacterium leprae TaxID=1769 RepID=UPI0013A66E65|nr:DUF1067 domain-containing protein [Mycobacterium leprae]